MKIILTAVTRYEPDIIESFCRYYLSFIDGILLYEGSDHTDNTIEILEQLRKEGLNIIPYSPPVGARDVDRPTLMLTAAFQEYGADLVLPLDPDEFLFHVDGENPRQELEAAASDAQVMLEWETYVYEREPNDDTLFLPDYFSERRVKEARPLFKTAIKREFYLKHKGKLKLDEGRHACLFTATNLMAPNVKSDKLRLAHYPVRNMNQIMSKALTGRLLFISRRMPDSSGIQWVEMFERVKRQGALSVADLREFSLYYSLSHDQKNSFELCQEPLPVKFFEKPKLKYTSYGRMREVLIRDLLVRMEEIIRDLLVREKKKDNVINWGKLGEMCSARLTKFRRSAAKRLSGKTR